MKPERNDPCPCGSGKKYKKCCGSSQQQTATDTSSVEPTTAAERHCGTCTACCDGWVRMNIRGHEVYPGKPC
ncbi:MAG TPA: SEC-C metal-binding domain-containing protein, partial [Sulfuricaulis sp.]